MTIVKNIAALYAAQTARLILPLLIIPILTRSLGDVGFGVYIFSIGVAAWVSIFVEYGFTVSSSRAIARAEGFSEVKSVVEGTQSARYILSIAVIFVGNFLCLAIPAFHGSYLWAFVAVGLGILVGITPLYYYQATHRVVVFSIIEVTAGVLLLIFTYFFVDEQGDGVLLAAVLLLSKLISVLLLHFIMYSNKRVAAAFNLKAGLRYLKEGVNLFRMQVTISFYTAFNIVFLGFFSGAAEVGWFGAAERIIRAGLGFVGQATAVIFPRMVALKKSQSASEVARFRMLNILAFFLVGVIGLLIVLCLSPYMVLLLFGEEKPEVVKALNVMAWVMPAISLSNVQAFQFLLVDGKEGVLNRVLMWVSVLNVPAAYFFIKFFGWIGMAYSWVVIEWCIVVVLYFAIKLDCKRVEG